MHDQPRYTCRELDRGGASLRRRGGGCEVEDACRKRRHARPSLPSAEESIPPPPMPGCCAIPSPARISRNVVPSLQIFSVCLCGGCERFFAMNPPTRCALRDGPSPLPSFLYFALLLSHLTTYSFRLLFFIMQSTE